MPGSVTVVADVLQVPPPLGNQAISTVATAARRLLVELHAPGVVLRLHEVLVVEHLITYQRSLRCVQVAPWIKTGLLDLVDGRVARSHAAGQRVVAGKCVGDPADHQQAVVRAIPGSQAGQPRTGPLPTRGAQVLLAGRVRQQSTLPVRATSGLLEQTILIEDLVARVQISLSAILAQSRQQSIRIVQRHTMTVLLALGHPPELLVSVRQL
ncbi:MAG: hypothetical protein WC455_11105 [Dehalococcoidia bacterium]